MDQNPESAQAATSTEPDGSISGTTERFDPTSVLRPGRFDSTALLVLWCLRKAFFPLIWIGLIIALLVSQDTAALSDQIGSSFDDLSSPTAAFGDLLSPLAGIVIAIGLRLVVGWLALALAFPVTRSTSVTDYPARGKWRATIRMWRDRIHMMRSLRSLRWLWLVRNEAARRLGDTGKILAMSARLVTWSNPVLIVALILTTQQVG